MAVGVVHMGERKLSAALRDWRCPTATVAPMLVWIWRVGNGDIDYLSGSRLYPASRNAKWSISDIR